jgi:hypothetical protein
VEQRDSVERLVRGYSIIGRCDFGVVEVLMWYGREVVRNPTDLLFTIYY